MMFGRFRCDVCGDAFEYDELITVWDNKLCYECLETHQKYAEQAMAISNVV